MRHLPPIIYVLLLATFLAKTSLFLATPFLSIYLMESYHYSATQIGVILSAAGVGGIVMSTFAGSLIDRFNKQQIIYIGLMITIASYAMFPIIHSYLGFIAFSFVSTIGASLVDPTYRVLLAEYTPQDKKKLVFNVRYYLINIAAAIGPLLAAQLLFLGMNRLFYSVSITFAVNLLLFIVLFRTFKLQITENPGDEKIPFFNALYIFKKNPAFLFLLLGNLFIIFGYNQMSSTLSQYLGHQFDYSVAVKNYAYLLLVNAITVLTCQYFVFRVSKLMTTSTAMMIGAVLLPTGLILFGVTTNLIGLAIAMFIFTIGEMFVFTMWDIRIDEISEPHLKGSYYSLTGLTGLSRIIAPLIGGIFLDTVQNGVVLFAMLGGITYCAVYFFKRSRDASQ